MKKIVLPIIPLMLSITVGCTDNAQTSESTDANDRFMQAPDNDRFKLYPTENIWTFIKLDTRTGQMWQVQYSVESNDMRFEQPLNPKPLVASGTENGRFELYPTQNIYNFILLDQVNGNVWQVQWSFEEETRGIAPITCTAQRTTNV